MRRYPRLQVVTVLGWVITVSSIALMVVGIWLSVVFKELETIAPHAGTPLGPNDAGVRLVWFRQELHIFALAVVGFLAGVGLLRRREWGRRCGIGLSLLLLFFSLVDVSQWMFSSTLALEPALNRACWVVLAISLWRVLTRSNVKTQFRKSP